MVKIDIYIRRLLYVAALLAAPVLARAETVELTDGRVFDGELISETNDLLAIRESAGDSFIDVVYEKSEVKSIGSRSIEAEVQALAGQPDGGKPASIKKTAKPAIDFESRERAEYEIAVKDIVDEVKRLSSLWNINRYDYEGFRQWFNLFSSRAGRFKEQYGSGSTTVSFSMMNMVFQELGHFEELVQGMEKASRSYEKNVSMNASESWSKRFQDCLNEDERLAAESIRKAVDYAALAKEKICRR